MKVSKYIADFIASLGVHHVFTLLGGFSMHLNDSIGHHPDLESVYMLDERGAAIAAEAYAKASGNIGVVVVTAGPGVTNALTGVAAAWLDSTPILVISGDVKTSDLNQREWGELRQGGAQDVPTQDLVLPIVKRVLTIWQSGDYLDFAGMIQIAMSGRPGPVWVNVPLNIQGTQCIDGSKIQDMNFRKPKPNMELVKNAADRLTQSERPVILLGAGVNCAHAREDAHKLIDMLGIPIMTTWPALDLIPFDHPFCVGRPGASGMRGANLALQEADLLLCIGARLDGQTTAYNVKDFGRNAYKIVVDIDKNELGKLRGQIDMKICADAGDFIRALLQCDRNIPCEQWIQRCQELKATHSMLAHCRTGSYALVEILSEVSSPNDVFTIGPASQVGAIFLASFRNKEGQRVYHSAGLGSMGFDVPYAIGACLGSSKRRTICVTGDGSIMQNIQELKVIRRLGLPIKIFAVNNTGYASIRQSQQKHFGRICQDYPMPSVAEIARAFGIYSEIVYAFELGQERIKRFLDMPFPCLIEIIVNDDELLMPRVETVIGADGVPRSGTIDKMMPDIWSK